MDPSDDLAIIPTRPCPEVVHDEDDDSFDFNQLEQLIDLQENNNKISVQEINEKVLLYLNKRNDSYKKEMFEKYKDLDFKELDLPYMPGWYGIDRGKGDHDLLFYVFDYSIENDVILNHGKNLVFNAEGDFPSERISAFLKSKGISGGGDCDAWNYAVANNLVEKQKYDDPISDEDKKRLLRFDN
jgi:hypothetical protein